MSDWVARGLGLFYLAGGLMVVRALAANRLADAVLEALSGGTQPKDRARFFLLALGAALTTLSGLALLSLSRWAVALMLANVAAQAVWLIYAGRYFPPEDEDDAIGRRRTTHAAIGFLAATVLVVWLERSGRVAFAASGWVDAALALAALASAGWAVHVWRWGALGGGVAAVSPEPEAAAPAFDPPKSIRLEPAFGAWPLWDGDSGRNVDPFALGLPEALTARIRAFEDATLAATDPDHDDGPSIADRAALPALEAEAAAICRDLVEFYGEDGVSWRLPGG